MSVIVPTILTASREDIEQKLERVKGLVDSVQLDVVDGVYAGPPTWPYSEGKDGFIKYVEAGLPLSEWGNFRYELDLMVGNPEEVVGAWVRMGAQRVLIHVESTNYLPQILDELENTYGHIPGFAPDLLSVGLAIQIDTPTDVLDQYLERIDYVQFMGIASIGKQGQPYDPRVVKKIEAFHQAHPDVLIQVDGGVSLTTAPALLAAGARRLVAGSALWKSENIKETLAQFEDLATRYGRYS